VRCDGALIERLLANLLDNAAKYGRRRSPADVESTFLAEVSARIDDATMAVTVGDRGPGLPQAVLKARSDTGSFAKFARGAPESATPGLGLGLSICQAIVTVHGGRFDYRDREGGGAEFEFTLPLLAPPPVGVDDGLPLESGA
jgi:two-component system sensor histidine kinase KdpD